MVYARRIGNLKDAPEGTMASDLMGEIHKDHQEVSQIFKKLEQAGDAAQRKTLLQQLKDELVPHMKAEEKTVYPSLRDDAKEDVQHALEEHQEADEQMQLLLGTDPMDASFTEKVMQLKDMVEHHVQEEESKVFKDLKQFKSQDELGKLLQDFTSAKQSIRQTTH
jgi:hemerythrin superfamily protein